jgi:DNA-binding beta-propeller fold protein YncE
VRTIRVCFGIARGARRIALLAAVAAFGPGCASTWVLKTNEPAVALQWPFPPNPAKLTYVRSLTGLVADDTAATVVTRIVFGKEDEARNAFVLPVAVAVGGDGRLAVADMGRKCVHLYLPGAQRYVRLSGSDDDPISSPVGVVFDDESRLFVTDSSGKVLAFDASGKPLFTLRRAGEKPLERPTGIAYSPEKKLLYVVDTLAHAVHAFRPDGEAAFSFGARSDAEGGFNFPTHIFRSSAGELYVTDALNFRIGIFDETGKPLGSFGHHGDGSGDLAMPKGVAVDRDGIVYVVDGLFDNVQLFYRMGRFLLTLGGRVTDHAEFWLPSGAFIAGDQLSVCDTNNGRVQIFRITEGYGNGRDQ